MEKTLVIRKETIVYVLCIPTYKSGGPELLHQLNYILNTRGINSMMCYHGGKLLNPTHDEFKKYVTKYCFINDVIDSDYNYLIVPEVYFDRTILRFRKIKIIPWWLSVDNYALAPLHVLLYRKINFIEFLRQIKYRFSKNGNKYTLTPKQLSNYPIHLSQSFYANQFIKKKHISNSPISLGDFINDSYFDVSTNSLAKENIVVYNPAKGYNFTKKLIKAYPNIIFIPLHNMTNLEMINTMMRAKVYIDFGNHPGKDRIPREAAILKCIIITNKRGSAKNDVDVPIPSKYKFKDKKRNIKRIGNRILYTFNHYKEVIDEFSDYRRMIMNEKEIFIKTIDKIFLKNY